MCFYAQINTKIKNKLCAFSQCLCIGPIILSRLFAVQVCVRFIGLREILRYLQQILKKNVWVTDGDDARLDGASNSRQAVNSVTASYGFVASLISSQFFLLYSCQWPAQFWAVYCGVMYVYIVGIRSSPRCRHSIVHIVLRLLGLCAASAAAAAVALVCQLSQHAAHTPKHSCCKTLSL